MILLYTIFDWENIIALASTIGALASAYATFKAYRIAKNSYASSELFNHFQMNLQMAEAGKDYRQAMSELEIASKIFESTIIFYISLATKENDNNTNFRNNLDCNSYNRLCQDVINGLNTITIATGNKYEGMICNVKEMDHCYVELSKLVFCYYSNHCAQIIAKKICLKDFNSPIKQYTHINGEMVEYRDLVKYKLYNDRVIGSNNQPEFDASVIAFIPDLDNIAENLLGLSSIVTLNTAEEKQLSEIAEAMKRYFSARKNLFCNDWMVPKKDNKEGECKSKHVSRN